MPRIARVIAVGLPHHVTQRGNNRQRIFDSDEDRLVYLKLLRSMPNGSAFSLGAAWGQSFSYDGFGNLTDKNVTAGSAAGAARDGQRGDKPLHRWEFWL